MGYWSTAPDGSDEAMEAYDACVIKPLVESLHKMIRRKPRGPDAAAHAWAEIGVLAEVKEEAPGIWRQIFDPQLDFEKPQEILAMAFDKLEWLRMQHDWIEDWADPGQLRRSMTRWEKILLQHMSRRTLGAGWHR